MKELREEAVKTELNKAKIKLKKLELDIAAKKIATQLL